MRISKPIVVIAAVAILVLVVILVVGVGSPRSPPPAVPAATPTQIATPAPVPIRDAAPLPIDAPRVIDRPVKLVTAPPTPRPKAASNDVVAMVMRDSAAQLTLPGGPPTIRYGTHSGPTRRVAGVVVNRAHEPVAGASVLVDSAIHVRGTISVAAAATTDATGRFTIDAAPASGGVALAVFHGDWSELSELTDAPIELHLAGHGGLTAAFTYNGLADTFAVSLRLRDRPFDARYPSDSDGHLAVESLPPGAYLLEVSVEHGLADGQGETVERELAITAGHTTELAVDLKAGGTVALTVRAPDGVKTPGFVYWLFSGAAPATGAEARTRSKTEKPPTLTFGGTTAPAQFHDVRPGAYAACAAIFDVHTMGALDSPFGCAPVVVRGEDGVVEREIVLLP